jgi:hypothetical protein
VRLEIAACISAFSADSRETSCACEARVEERVVMRVAVLRRSSINSDGVSSVISYIGISRIKVHA